MNGRYRITLPLKKSTVLLKMHYLGYILRITRIIIYRRHFGENCLRLNVY